MAQPEPVVVGIGLVAICKVGATTITDVEQIPQHLDRLALLALAQQRGHGHAQVLSEQVEQGRLDGSDGVHGDAQVEGLQPAPTRITVGKSLAHGVEHALVVPDGLADHQGAGVLEGLANLLAAGHLAQAGVAGTVAQYHDVAGEERAMGATEVEQHAVVSGHRDHAQLGDHWRGEESLRGCLHVHEISLGVSWPKRP